MGGYELIDTSSDGCCGRKTSYTLIEVLKKVLNLVDTAILLVCVVGIDIGLIMFTNRQTAVPLFVPALYLLVTMIMMVRDVNYAFDRIYEEEPLADEDEEEDQQEDYDNLPPLINTDTDADSDDDLPPLINANEERMSCLNSMPTYVYDKNERVLAQLQKVVDETNVRNIWRRTELKVD